ncbi:MAG: carboxymuconolactone decarboxylase family protein [Planctomycetes bacterium]|nr:carboxymuconolactone decarboxylase family protein [Planctomycetota bacterium]
MNECDAALTRAGLDRRMRLLVIVTAAIARANWPLAATAMERARDAALSRTDLEETLLQGVLFFGFPRIVTAFEQAALAWPADVPPAGGALPEDEQEHAGRALFDRIYGRNAPAVHAMLRGHHHELHDFVIRAAYGRVLTRPALPPRDRELLAVAALAALDQTPQLVAHARGARTFGATDVELRETLVTVLGDEPVVDEHLRRIG